MLNGVHIFVDMSPWGSILYRTFIKKEKILNLPKNNTRVVRLGFNGCFYFISACLKRRIR